jgi:peptide/nickel transport system substrate-binding protein
MGDRPADRPAGEPAGIRTFLIADVRGYTLFTQERGDEAAAKLAARFAGIAREAVEEHGGSVIELRGDEALAVFTSARQAILAATHAQDRFLEETLADPTLPLPVGIGLDAGEAVPVEGGYRGGALNLAARLCGQAGPGEILASQGVIHLARKVDGVRTQDRGELHLKNLTEPVRVFRLISEESDPAIRFREFAPAPPKREVAPIRMARAHPIVAAVVALALLAVIAVPAGIALRSGGGSATIVGDALAKIDVNSGDVTGSVVLASRPGDIATDNASVWVTLPDDGAVDLIDPQTMTVRDTIPVGADPTGIAIGGGSVWVSNGGSSTVSRISQDTDRVVDTIEIPGGGPSGIAVGLGGVWVANSYSATVSRIDPASGKVIATVAVGDRPVDVAIDDRSIWVANAASGTVSQIDPARNVELQQPPVGNGPQAIAAGGGSVWVANALGGTVARLDGSTGAVTRTINVGPSLTGVTLVGGSTWVSQGSQGSIAEIEPGSDSPTVTPLGSEAAAIAPGEGVLWASVRGSVAAHEGGTLTVWGVADFFDTLDPAFAYLPQSWAMLALTNDGLVGFRRTSGLAGASLVPDLATFLPPPTTDGRMYTFTLRAGITYSTGAPVRPEDFRRAIERVFTYADAKGNPSPAVQYYSNIAGANRCGPGRPCDLSGGIVTDDVAGTVTFHLTKPNPDFLYGLALPFAFAVPADTPDTLPKGASIPATGPYFVQTRSVGQKKIVFARNPRFSVWSDARPNGIPDEIVWRFASDPGQPTKEVLASRGDLAWFPPAPQDFEAVATNHAGQFYVTPKPSTFYLSFDTAVAPFDNVSVRRALNFAIDRRKVQKMFGPGSTATCQILPPNFPGYEAYCPYTRDPGTTWTAPDMETAQRLVDRSGTVGMAVQVWTSPDWFPEVADYARDLLIKLGYRAAVKFVSNDAYEAAFFGRPRKAPIGTSGWSSDYPAESGFLGSLATCDAPSNESGFCDRTIDRRIEAATWLQITQPALAHERWASIEHDVMDQAPWVPLVNRSFGSLVSQRLGNFLVSPQWGPLVEQMWVK